MKPSVNWDTFLKTPRLILAPMEGVVDAIVRELICDLGATDLCVTEFVRIVDHLLPDRIFYQYAPELHNQSQTTNGTPVFVQLLGSDPVALAENAAKAVSLGAAGIDLNFGCPAKTVNRHDGGASLLKSPERLLQMISAVRKAVDIDVPVTAKVRLGFDHKNAACEIAQAAEEAQATWLTVHARTKTDGYRPPAYWEYIQQMKDAVKIPLIANGEVWTTEDYWRCRKVSGCEHVMIGRGWMANPALGLQIKNKSNKKPWSHWQNYFLNFMEKSQNFRNPGYAVQRTKQLAKIMAQSYGEALSLLQKIKTKESFPEMYTLIERDF